MVTTATCRDALLADLNRIRGQLEIGFSERIHHARALGGAVSNAEYAAVLDERKRAMDSLDRLDRILERATVVDEAAWPRDREPVES
jgi:transcription elongation GreA/GreB family factor